MTTGIYRGITIFESRISDVPVSLTGNGNMNITGTFYAASAAFSVAGNGSGNVIGSQYVSYDLTTSGNGAININWNANATARTRAFGLRE
jgi:hypothetical protein